MLFGTQRINDAGHLEIGGCDAVDLAARHGTPLYVIDESALREHCRAYLAAFRAESPETTVAFASKAFLCKAAAQLVHECGLHLDVASLGELLVVQAAGVPMGNVTLHGNFKKDEDLEAALESRVGLVAIDSIDEARRLSELAALRGVRQRSILRVAPGIDAKTLDAISTGRNDTKFGVTVENGAALAAIEECLALPGVELVGIHAHIGSQITSREPFELLAETMMSFAATTAESTDWSPELIVVGGGLGIHYESTDDPPTLTDLARAIVGGMREAAERHGVPVPHIGVEPGRSLIGELGTTLYTVGPIKTVPIGDGKTRTYVTVDGGLSDNPRPVMYGSKYPLLLANRAEEPADREVRIAGRHCETDTLFSAEQLPAPRSGDVLAVQLTGAYNHVMASNYNFFYRPAVVFVSEGKSRVVVRRETQEDLLAREVDA